MDIQRVKSEIAELDAWLAERGHKYLSINTVPEGKWLNYLRSHSSLFGMAWRQLFRISPVDFRPAFGSNEVRTDPKATILFALAYLELTAAGDRTYAARWQESLRRVLELQSGKVRHFGVRQNNTLYMKAYQASEDDVSPLLTAWAGRLFLRAFRYTGDSQYLNYAHAVARYFLDEHPREERPQGIYFYYDPSISDTIFNASGEISSYLVEYGALAGVPEASELGQMGLRYLIANQNTDGSWFYGPTSRFRYIDNFHTAFVLNAVASAADCLYWPELNECLAKGLQYFTKSLFSETTDGLRPIHLDRRFRPFNSNLIQAVDLRDVTASVVLFLEVAKKDRQFGSHADRLLHWALKHLRTPQGTYCPEITLLWTNRLPYIEFQAWMLYCLARYENSTARLLCHT